MSDKNFNEINDLQRILKLRTEYKNNKPTSEFLAFVASYKSEEKLQQYQ